MKSKTLTELKRPQLHQPTKTTEFGEKSRLLFLKLIVSGNNEKLQVKLRAHTTQTKDSCTTE